ncbi:MAG: hypothetical protein JEY79_13405 [Pseudodesulfovibrio sp.]|nr:hypothetical protein [Pseudodesulfovibrio sp.]
MNKISYALSLFVLLGLLVACGGEEETDTVKFSETEPMTEKVQSPFTSAEFEKFLKDLPFIPGMTIRDGIATENASANQAPLSDKDLSTVKSLGWDEERFMYIYSHSVSVMSVEQMTQVMAEMNAQMENMPEEQKQMMKQMMNDQVRGQMDELKVEVDNLVPPSEQTIIRDNLNALYTALGIQKQY